MNRTEHYEEVQANLRDVTTFETHAEDAFAAVIENLKRRRWNFDGDPENDFSPNRFAGDVLNMSLFDILEYLVALKAEHAPRPGDNFRPALTQARIDHRIGGDTFRVMVTTAQQLGWLSDRDASEMRSWAYNGFGS